ncbi:MAG: DUF6713 family protein [Burkholderiales bacterium]|jgi:hypothetical protein
MPDPRLCLANLTVLLVHQIDAAYWHEWELFGIPGGNPVNLLLNLPIVALGLHAWARVALGAADARRWAAFVAALGALTVVLHAGFFAAGHDAFAAPVSIGLLVATGVLSMLQAIDLRRSRPVRPPLR